MNDYSHWRNSNCQEKTNHKESIGTEEKRGSPGVLVGQARAGATHTFPLHFSYRQLLSEAQLDPIAPPVPDIRGVLVL